jgi:5-(carboxyamino)imidazole ribonucleotide synthase
VGVLEGDFTCPAVSVTDKCLYRLKNQMELHAFVTEFPFITTEFENVSTELMEELVNAGAKVYPGSNIVAIAQNRIQEKLLAQRSNVKTTDYWQIEHHHFADIEKHVPNSAFPAILKTITLGYDGKGQKPVADLASLEAIYNELSPSNEPLILEKKVAIWKEVSVQVARGIDGMMSFFPVCENIHEKGILAYTIALARIPTNLNQELQQLTAQLAEKLNYVGLLCVEYFINDEGEILFNEMAPRPHNSGHHTMNSCNVSQFDLQARAVLELPLIPVKLNNYAVMVNLLGNSWFNSHDVSINNNIPQEPNWHDLLSLDDVHLHLYEKTHPAIGRKMGHITCLASTLELAIEKANEVNRLLHCGYETLI